MTPKTSQLSQKQLEKLRDDTDFKLVHVLLALLPFVLVALVNLLAPFLFGLTDVQSVVISTAASTLLTLAVAVPVIMYGFWQLGFEHAKARFNLQFRELIDAERQRFSSGGKDTAVQHSAVQTGQAENNADRKG